MEIRPPCWPDKTPCPNDCAAKLLNQHAHNHVNLTGPWDGWRLRGRDLVSPTGLRLSPERVAGMAWREHNEARLQATKARAAAAAKAAGQQPVKVVIVTLADYRQNGVAAG
ncbi:DUF3653 domain-containing protein [Lysobacter enzymogenes]|uniref:DUF3653 domain-containing protein n=1 Tax=Lysobacter enzymogenes TaxID=69 RepID=UPI001AF40E94|nr:DUF3653 domain-containing protein [Lysobacter enzymogenes]QQQ03664.1 hypothetical protein JHW41_12310 [Lysobacter enzymogenes]